MLCGSISTSHFSFADTVDDEPAPKFGFSVADIYREQSTSLSYVSSQDIESVEFRVQDHEGETLDTIAAEDVNAEEAVGYIRWNPLHNPSGGEILVAYERTAGGTFKPTEHAAELHDTPALSLESYNSEKTYGGVSVAVRGQLSEGSLIPGAALRVQLVDTSDEVISKASVEADAEGRIDDVLKLPKGKVGEFKVELLIASSGNKVVNVFTPIRLNTTLPTVLLTPSDTDVYVGEVVSIRGKATAGGSLKSVTITSNGASLPLEVDENGNFTYTVDTAAMSTSTYAYTVVARDEFGNVSAPASVSIVVRPAPVPPGDDTLIDEVEVIPISTLSTDFSIPVARTLVSDVQQDSDMTGDKISGEVLGAEERNLAQVIDLNSDSASEADDAALSPGATGWSVFGLSWYWWLMGGATTWMGVISARWWLRRS